jgi:HEAT repeat protein
MTLAYLTILIVAQPMPVVVKPMQKVACPDNPLGIDLLPGKVEPVLPNPTLGLTTGFAPQFPVQRKLALPPPPPTGTTTPTATFSEEQLLKSANLQPTGPALVEFFRKRTPPGPDRAALDALVTKLGDKDAATADKVAGELVSLGQIAVPALRPVANNADGGEATVRARKCLQLIDGGQAAGLTSVAARLLGEKKADGAAEALIGFAPFAEDDRVAQEIEASLVAVALRDGKPDPALIQALKDESPVRRATAAAVLCQAGGSSVLAAVRPLLKDPKPSVRLRASTALIDTRDPEAVPVLIDLLAELPTAQRKRAEEHLNQLAGEWAIVVPNGEDATSRRLRREMWLAWWRGLEGAPLVDELRSRTLAEDERVGVSALIAKLTDANAEVRNTAEAELLEQGPKVAPLLRQFIALHGGRNSQQAVKCLQLVEKNAAPALPTAAVRLIGLRRPTGTVEALLGYLPFAESGELSQQVRETVTALAGVDPDNIAVLVKALQDPAASRRAVAAQALCAAHAEDHLPAVRKLLTDADSEVRLRAALGLATLREKDAVPVLIALLAELPIDQAYDAEDYLSRIAGDKAPAVPLSPDAAVRAKARDAWSAWWKDNADKVDLAATSTGERSLGFLLVVEQYNAQIRSGRVMEVDRAGKTRWEITGLQGPLGAQVLPGEHVLIAEQNINQVTERDLTGKIVWQKQINQPFHVQRMRNGHTFIAGRNVILELDRDGKEIINQPRFNDTILAAAKLRDGQIAVVTYQGLYYRLDATGKEVKSVRMPFVNNGLFGEVLPNDHVIISNQGIGKVTEYDADGKVVWEAQVVSPGTPTRLSNGNTLVPMINNNRMIELDRSGKVVNEHKDLPYRAWRVTRR